ncbi:MAG: 50S ribosomal protein L6 [FCB group bacterium]|nr:50S ribosomal protein L6 [FCB group bacterium]
MSRVGKQPILIPDKTKVEIKNDLVTVTGPKGTLALEKNPGIGVVIENKQIVISRSSDIKKYRALHGLTRALLNNMVIGVTEGYTKELKMIGVGYRAEIKGKNLIMYLGYSHPIVLSPPDDIKIEVLPKESKIIITGIDKELVGQVAAKIRSFRKPEPYKGKGVRYVGEYVRTKAGKTAG